MSLYPLVLTLALLLLSGAVGLPLAAYFLGRDGTVRLLALAVSLGFGLIHLTVFLGTKLVQEGTDRVALPALMFLLMWTLVFVASPPGRRVLFGIRGSTRTWGVLIGLFLVAGSHVLLPVLLGRWEMAFATGDDASRWYMVVSYFRTEVFEYLKVADRTLQWPLVERPLQSISGALIVSLFNTTPAIAYSISSAMAVIVAAFSLLFLYETWFKNEDGKSRWFIWVLIALFFGFFGVFTNIYYTGRITHHFSLYPVIASLGFVGVTDKGLRRWVWFSLWCVILAYCYSIRFSVNFVALAAFIIFFQWVSKEIGFRRAVVNMMALTAGLIVSSVAAYRELEFIVKGMVESNGFLLMQRGSDYGADGSMLDRILKWSGFLGTFDSHELVKHWALFFGALSGYEYVNQWALLFLLLGMILVMVCVALAQAFRSLRSQPSYMGLLAFNMLIGAILFARGNYFVAWKMSLYWPAYIFVGFLGFAGSLYYGSTAHRRKIGLFLLMFAGLYISMTARQLSDYMEMVEQRATKVDSQSYVMVDALKKSLPDCSNCRPLIFGFDYSPERHLLLREIFRDFDWQPLRGKELNFENDIIVRHTSAQMDQYRYAFLLYANAYKCEAFDFSGNLDSLIYEHFPIQIFGQKSSLLEPIEGMEPRIYGPYDKLRHCSVYGMEVTGNTARLVFANNGAHSWLDLTVRVYGEGVGGDMEKFLSLTATAGQSSVEKLSKTQDYGEYHVHLSELQDSRLVQLNLLRRADGRILLTHATWGR